VVDDDRNCRSLVSALLTQAGYAVREAATGRAARAAAADEQPGIVILDIKLPDLSGYEICREFRDDYGENLPILFLTGERTDQLDRVGGLLLGADDYVVKPFDPDELLARVNRVATRVGIVPRRASKRSPVEKLTERELQVLSMLAEGMNQKEIARELVLSQKTVATHLQRVLSKLDVHSRAQAVAVAHRYRLVETRSG
jgi:DNA-binding NarL/FixJ family response regulator